MLLELISKYYNLLWILFFVIIGLKILLAYLFHGELEGSTGVVFALFKWYNEDEQELADTPGRRTMMRFHNVVTIGIYLSLLIVIGATLLPMFITPL
jgi:hypothetical protein